MTLTVLLVAVLALAGLNHARMKARVRAAAQQAERSQADLQRIADAAEAWYDDKKDSKAQLRAAVERKRFPVGGHRVDCLMVRLGGADVCDCDGPGWTCGVCGSSADEHCDAGLHG